MSIQAAVILRGVRPAETQAHLVLPPPKAQPLHEVFAEAMLDETSAHQHRSPFDWVASIFVHFAILAVLLVLPLYFTSGLDIQRFNLTFLAAPAVPPAPPPPPMASAVAVKQVHTARAFIAGKLTVPTFIPREVAKINDADNADDLAADVTGGVPGGIPGGQAGGVLGGVLGGALKMAPPPAAPAIAQPKQPVRVGGVVKAPKLLFAPDPVYPLLAQRSRIAGIVVIDAIIDEHGNVVSARVVSGHPILIPAALEAVSKRKYEPTILDGEPTAIDLRVEVGFRME